VKRLGRIALVAAAVLAVAAAGLAWLWRDYQRAVATPLPIAGEGYELVLEPGATLARLTDRLVADGLITHPYHLRVLAVLGDKDGRLQAGEYRIAPGSTLEDLLAQLVAGRVVQRALTIVEGWTVAQMLEAVRAAPRLEWDLGAGGPAALAAAIGKPELHPEGQFLPETYYYTRDTAASTLLARAHAALERTLAEAWRERREGLPYESPYEALIMASIIEKETAVAEERGRIAGVFVRRLRRGMRLQTDPTVIYGLGERFDGNLRKADLAAETPYNTYVVRGLPPTPIALPGKAAIRAAVDPAPGEALYFVARGDGSHEFSDTLEAHNRAVRRYQLGGEGAGP